MNPAPIILTNPVPIIITVLVLIVGIIVAVFVLKSMKGKLTLTLSKGGYNSGEAVSGTLDVALKKSLDANRLFVALVGYEEYERRESDGDRRTERREVYRDEYDVENAGQHLPAGFSKSYTFELTAPGAGAVPRESGGGMQISIGPVNLGGNRSRMKWKVEARLDTKGLDLTTSRSVSINVA